MKKLYNSIFITTLCLSFLQVVYAQLPATNYFYYASSGSLTMYNYNTTTNTSTVNSIALPSGNIGLAVNNNFFSGPAMTFWTQLGGNFAYYNGSAWINTGHAAMAVNMGGAGPYIYTYNGSSGQVYRYNGTGPATLILTLPGSLGPYDLTGDASGNFFVMKTNAPPYTLSQYSPTGTLMATYTMVGFPSGTAGGGFAFIGGKLYADISGTTVWGTISGTTITYGGPLSLSVGPGDLANWPLPITPLPVEMISFQGKYNADTRLNELSWETTTEINNDYFTIEYSENGIEWEWMMDVSGAGNSNVALDYSATHDSPFQTTYYRLKQTDYDGMYTYYDPITITKPDDAVTVSVYPNPASDILNLSVKETYDHYVIMDETGRILIQENNPGGNQHAVDISTLQSGIYFLSVYTGDQMVTKRFVKR